MRCALQGLADPDPRVVNEGMSNPQMWKGETPNFFKKVSSASANLPKTCHPILSAVIDSCDFPFRTQDITPLVAGTHADVVPALLHLLQVFARLALKNQTTRI